MRDVGFALAAASEYGQTLSRIHLQKLIYLVDVMVYLVELLPPSEKHLTYKHGPFDAAIQNAVDCLAFRGLVQVLELHRELDGKTRAKYGLTAAGRTWVKKLLSDSQFQMRAQVAASVAKEIDSLGWEKLVKLVYAEPTFVTARAFGYGTRLDSHNPLINSAALVLETMRRGLSVGFEHSVPQTELLFKLFFRYLNNFSLLKDQTHNVAQSAGGAL